MLIIVLIRFFATWFFKLAIKVLQLLVADNKFMIKVFCLSQQYSILVFYKITQKMFL